MHYLRSGHMYMFPAWHDIYAVLPCRLWWAPWRWELNTYWWLSTTRGLVIGEPNPIATNISKAECIGLIKMLGYNKDLI